MKRPGSISDMGMRRATRAAHFAFLWEISSGVSVVVSVLVSDLVAVVTSISFSAVLAVSLSILSSFVFSFPREAANQVWLENGRNFELLELSSPASEELQLDAYRFSTLCKLQRTGGQGKGHPNHWPHRRSACF